MLEPAMEHLGLALGADRWAVWWFSDFCGYSRLLVQELRQARQQSWPLTLRRIATAV